MNETRAFELIREAMLLRNSRYDAARKQYEKDIKDACARMERAMCVAEEKLEATAAKIRKQMK